MTIKKDENTDVTLNFKGGGSFVKLPPIFSADAQSVFVSWKNVILEYNTVTGKLIHEYKGLSGHIIGFSYHVYDTYNCITACSKSGKVILWKTVTHYKIFEKSVPSERIKTFCVIPSENDDFKGLISYSKNNQIKFAITELEKKANKIFKIHVETDRSYFIGTSKKYFAVVSGNSIYFLKFNGIEEFFNSTIQESRLFTCITCHSTEEIVLTGDTSGRVVVWQNIFSRKIIQSVFHWHTLPLQTVCFSTLGSYFYSGGSECVLVKWQLENVNDKKFVPRLPSEICHLAVANNNTLIAVATKDNAIRIYDNVLNHKTIIQHLVLGKQYDCGIVYDPRTRSLIMNGNQGCIQFYSPEDMSLLYNVDVIAQNKVTNERGITMVNTEITKLALSTNGLWLATVEERKDVEYQHEIRLKFWSFSETNQIFELNTAIEYPHQKSINSIMFQPTSSDQNLRCVTVGEDKKFKVWQLEETTSIYKKGKVWKCFGVGFHRNLFCLGLSFSNDGSLLSTGFESILSVWVPDTCELKCTLVHPVHKENVRFIQFGYGEQCHLLVSASIHQLSVWNLLTLSMFWTVPVTVSLLVADPFSTHMAVFTQDSKVFLFSPSSHEPIYINDKLLNKKIVAAAFVPTKNNNNTQLKWYERSIVYFLDSKNELSSLGTNEREVELEDINLNSASNPITPNSRSKSKESVKSNIHLYEADMGHKTIKKYLSGPLHTMVPIRFTCQSLLRSLVVQKQV